MKTRISETATNKWEEQTPQRHKIIKHYTTSLRWKDLKKEGKQHERNFLKTILRYTLINLKNVKLIQEVFVGCCLASIIR